MAMNEGLSSQPRTHSVFVGVTTVRPGDPVRVGLFNGVAQTASDGGASTRQFPLVPISSGSSELGSGVTAAGKYNVPNYCAIALSGSHKVPVLFTAARVQGDPIYITPAGVLTDTANAGANFLWGALDTPYPSGAAATVKLFVFVVCPVA